jgi:hypothetical protein
MNDVALAAYVAVRAFHANLVYRIARDERGEGVISTAIAVLIMAFLGALMWVGFKAIWGDSETNIKTQVTSIGK